MILTSSLFEFNKHYGSYHSQCLGLFPRSVDHQDKLKSFILLSIFPKPKIQPNDIRVACSELEFSKKSPIQMIDSVRCVIDAQCAKCTSSLGSK